MTIDGHPPVAPTPGSAPDARRARTPEEAARQFEELLVRQLVDTMTEGLFKSGLAGEEGPGWMEGQRDTQRDVLADVLTQHLVESGAFQISALLLRRWRQAAAFPAGTAPEADAPLSADGLTDQIDKKNTL